MSVGTIVFPGEAVNVDAGEENVIRLGTGVLKEEVQRLLCCYAIADTAEQRLRRTV
jgi:hypothetical protein